MNHQTPISSGEQNEHKLIVALDNLSENEAKLKLRNICGMCMRYE